VSGAGACRRWRVSTGGTLIKSAVRVAQGGGDKLIAVQFCHDRTCSGRPRL
jgi:hypothetical protein